MADFFPELPLRDLNIYKNKLDDQNDKTIIN